MKYDKNQFTIIPNKDRRRGLSPFLQTVYMWLCDHSDKEMKSFPSRKTLADECGMSIRTLDRSMQELVTLGLVVKSARYNQNEQSTNFYEVVLFAEGGDTNAGGSDSQSLGGDTNSTQNSTHLTQPIKLTTNVVDKADKRKPEINEMFDYWEKTTGLPISGRISQNRNACNNMLKKHGAENLQRLIGGVAQAQNDQYAPRIADFTQLQAKLSDLLVWGKKKGNNSKIGVIR